MQTDTQLPLPWYKVPITWLVFGIPLSAILVGIVLISLSIRHFDGLVVDDYYKEGLGINQVLQRQQQAATLGLTAELRLLPEDGTVGLQLLGNAQFISPASVTLGLYHSTRSDHDHVINLQALTPRQFRGMLPDLAQGRWNVIVETESWRMAGTMSWPVNSRTLKLNASR